MISLLLKRPLLYICLSFVVGMYIVSTTSLGNIAVFSTIALISLVVLLIKRFSIKNVLLILICVLMFISGCVYFDVHNDIKGKDLYSFRGKYCYLESTAYTTPVITDNSISFIANVNSIKCGNENVICNENIRLSHYIDEKSGIDNLVVPEAGDKISIGAVINIPDGAMNTSGFDYSRYLKSDGVFFQGEINLENINIVAKDDSSFSYKLEKFRQKCICFYDNAFDDDVGAVLKAFVLGDKSSLTPEIRESFSGSGLSHILAVSGLHVSVFITALASLLKMFEVSKKKQIITSVIGSILFVLFTGASVSAMRAGFMGVLALVAKFLYRKSDPLTVLSLAATVFCIINPNVIFDASFMLSFGATAGIIIFYESIASFVAPLHLKYKDKKYLHKHLKMFCDVTSVGVAAQIFIIPMLVYIFNGFSTMSVISTLVINVLLLPTLVSGLLFCMFSFISTTITTPLSGFMFITAKMIIMVSEFFSGFAFSKVIFGIVTPFFLLVYSTSVAFLIFTLRKDKLKSLVSLICATFLVFVYIINSYLNYNIAQVSFINVGQGDCTLVKAPGDCDVLIDAGGYAQSDSTGEFIIYPYLIKNGVYDIEYVVLSHLHADHIVGLYSLMDLMKIENIIISQDIANTEDADILLTKARELEIPIIRFEHGDKLLLNNDIQISVITPDKKQLKISDNENDKSLVVRLDYGESSFLFTGDITSETEKYILHYYSDMLKSDVLKVAHHGSEESSCDEFIKAVNPQYAYIPVGDNPFGHPSNDVLERLDKICSEIYRADKHHDVTFYFDDKGIKGVKYPKRQ